MFLIKEKDSDKIIGVLEAFDEAQAAEYCEKHSDPIFVEDEREMFKWVNELTYEPIRKLRNDRSPYSYDERLRHEEITEQTRAAEAEFLDFVHQSDLDMMDNYSEDYDCNDQRC